jgi:hypothetical protein
MDAGDRAMPGAIADDCMDAGDRAMPGAIAECVPYSIPLGKE